METYSEIQLIIMAAIFVVVLIVAYKSLSQMLNIGDGMALMLAFCVAVLSIIGLSDLSIPSEKAVTDSSGPSFKINFILLPYILLPIAIITTVIIRWIRKLGCHSKKGLDNEHPNG